MILVTVGTHHQPFDRLVRAAQALAELGAEVVVQAGTSEVPTPGCTRVSMATPAQLAEWLDAADVVITHGGPASLFDALERGIVPWMCPRSPAHGEHVDDHQLRFAGAMDGRVSVALDPEAIVQLARQQGLQALRRDCAPLPLDARPGFVEDLRQVVHRVRRSGRSDRGLRGRVARLLRQRTRRSP